MTSKSNKKKIISFAVELMKDELSFSEIKSRVIKKFKLDEESANEYVKIAFDTVSYLAKEGNLPSGNKVLIILSGFVVAIICSALYAFLIIRSGYNLVILNIIFAYIISYILFIISKRRRGLFMKLISALYVLFYYLLGEFILFLSVLIKEISTREIAIDNRMSFLFRSVRTFFSEYMVQKPYYEFILIFCSVLIAVSFFFGIRIKRIRD